jgi:hypothetical protein
MLSTYLYALVSAGLVMTGVVEPQGPERVAELNPGYMLVPLLLLVKCSSAPLMP